MMKTIVFTLVIAGCGNLSGFGGDVPPLATIRVETTGDFELVRTPGAAGEQLRVALVWGTSWLPEALCFTPPDSPELAAVVEQGCRNPLSFTPDRVAASVAVQPNEAADLTLDALPSADVMFGDVTARVAYGSLVVFDDRDRSGTLELARPRRLPTRGFDSDEEMMSSDIIYGASFVAMTEPDMRLAFREGAFVETGFYPRHGCSAPLPAFSILAAGGFSLADAVAATAAGTLPSEPAGSCSEAKPADATVEIPFRQSTDAREVGCQQRRDDASVRYREPPVERPDLDNRAAACTTITQLPGDPPADGITQLVVATRPDETCRGVTHYTLVGCHEGGVVCDAPSWDYRESPPDWWPCAP